MGIWYVSSTPSYALPNTGDAGSTIAHFVEYFVLTVLIAKTLDAHGMPFHHHVLVPTFVLMVTAAGLDELHQYLVPGRTPSWFDLSFDILGMILGFGLYSMMFHRRSMMGENIDPAPILIQAKSSALRLNRAGLFALVRRALSTYHSDRK